MSVHPYFRLSDLGGNAIFSAPNWDRASLLMDVFILVYLFFFFSFVSIYTRDGNLNPNPGSGIRRFSWFFGNSESAIFSADSGFLCKNLESGIRDISVQILNFLLQILPTLFYFFICFSVLGMLQWSSRCKDILF